MWELELRWSYGEANVLFAQHVLLPSLGSIPGNSGNDEGWVQGSNLHWHVDPKICAGQVSYEQGCACLGEQTGERSNHNFRVVEHTLTSWG